MVQALEMLEVVVGWADAVAAAAPGEAEPLTERIPTWKDIATVTVPGRTRRRTVIEKALAQAGMFVTPGAPALEVRVLDADSAEQTPVVSEQPPPQLVIGGEK